MVTKPLPIYLPTVTALRGLMLFWLLVVAQPVLAQYKVIEVDSVTRQASQPLPFDEPFTLKIPLKNKNVTSVYSFELLPRKTLQETLNQRKIKNINIIYPSFDAYSPVNGSGYKVETIGKTPYLFLFIDARGSTTQKLAAGIDSKKYFADNSRSDTKAVAAAEATLDSTTTAAIKQAAKQKQDSTYIYKTPAVEKALAAFAAANKNAVESVKLARQNRLLDPGRSYTFLWSTNTVSDEAWLAFDRLRLYRVAQAGSVVSVTDTARARLTRAYVALYNASQRRAGVDINLPDITVAHASDFVNPFRLAAIPPATGPAPWYVATEYTALEGYENAVLSSTPIALPSTVAVAYDKLASYILQEDKAFDSALKALYLTAPKKSSQRIRRLLALTNATYPNILAGFIPLDADCDGCKALDPIDDLRKYAARQANLKATIDGIDELYTVAQELAKIDAIVGAAVTNLKAYKDAAQAANNTLKDAVKKRNQMATRIGALEIGTFTGLSSSTSVLTFDARTKLSIGPDFGVVTTKPFSGTNNPYSFVPYLGFHVNFRPYNKDVPYKLYPHKPLHRLSAIVGWSLVNIDNGPKLAARAEQDSISSFFKAKGTLLTGFGIRLSSAVQFNLGSMWYFQYQKDDSAPVLTPRYVDRRLRAWPYVGITVDISLKELLNDITSILPAAPRSFTPPPSPAAVTN